MQVCVPFCESSLCASGAIDDQTGSVRYPLSRAPAVVALPAARWLRIGGLLGMFGLGRRKSAKA